MTPLTRLQRDWLLAAPESFDRVPVELKIPTLSVLIERGLVEVPLHGQEWRRTEKGRVVAQALRMEREKVAS